MTHLAQYSQREIDVWTNLYGLVGPGRAVMLEEIAARRQEIGEARAINRSMLRISNFAATLVKEGKLDFDEQLARSSGADTRVWDSICRPIPAATPARYGAAPFADTLIDHVPSIATPARFPEPK